MPRIKARPYQDTDIKRAIEEFGGRCFFRHPFSLGKTMLATRSSEACLPGVIICRTHLIIQWILHLEEEGYGRLGETIGSVVTRTAGGGFRELSVQEKVDMLSIRPAFSWYVLTFAMIRRVKATPERNEAKGSRTVREIWDDVSEEKGWKPEKRRRPAFEYPLPPCKSLIIDESHLLRGRKSQQFAGAYQLAVPTKARKAAERVFLLSATDIWRESDDLYPQLRLIDPAKFKSYWQFVDRYCLTEDTEFGTKVVGGRTKRIARLIDRYAISRDYDDPDVMLDIPPLLEEEIWSWLTPTSNKAYAKMEDKLTLDRKSGVGVGSGISKFSSITAHDKNKMRDLEEVIDSLNGAPYALFCWYRETADMLGAHFELPIFTGGKSSGTFNGRRVNRFTRTEAIKEAGSCVATIGCVQEGADLSHLRNMIFFEVDYTTGSMSQLRARLARWRKDGTTDPVRCWYILSAGTVDEIAFERQAQRGATTAEIADEIQRRRREKVA